MKYDQHDFEENILGAIKAEDHKRVIDIMLAEIGAMLSNNKAALVKAVVDSGKKIPENISDTDLVKLIVNGITNNNQTFLSNLVAALIKENQQYQNVDATGGILSGVGNIVSGLSASISAGLNLKAAQVTSQAGVTEAQDALGASKNNMYASILQAKAATEQAKYGLLAAQSTSASSSNTIITVSVVFGVLAVVGGLIYLMTKQSQQNIAAGVA